MVDAKQLKTEGLSWFRPGAVRPAVVCSGTILLSTGVPVVGRLQAKRERRRGLQVPGEVNVRGSDVVGELGNVCVLCRVVCCPVPCGGGVHLPFIGQGEGEFKHAALLSYMGKYGVQRRRVGGRFDGPCRDLVIMAYLVPEQW
jgi:hypothetical protein